MPLIKSKSKEAFKKNVETEMKHGKPQPQALAIAFSMKRKKKAQGGMINESAATEHKPMPEEKDKDSKMIGRNSGDKPAHNDSWTDKSTVAQAQNNSGRMVKPIKAPKMVPSTAFSVRLQDEEADLQRSAKVNNGPQSQPPKHDDEEGADRQGPKVPALDMKMMAEGGKLTAEEHMARAKHHMAQAKMMTEGGMLEDADHPGDEHRAAVDSEYGDGAEEDMLDEPASLQEDDDQMRPPKEEYMAGHFAAGGEITERASLLDSEEPIDESEMTDDSEAEEDHDASIAATIMAKRKKFASGGQVDLSRNADEDPNEEDQMSFNALKKENYSESEGLAQLDSPEDSNEDGREVEADKHDMVSAIRRKMMAKRAAR